MADAQQPPPRPVVTPANASAAASSASLRDRLLAVWPAHRRGLPAELDELLLELSPELPPNDELVEAARIAVANPDWQGGRRAYGLARWLRGRGWIAALEREPPAAPLAPVEPELWQQLLGRLGSRLSAEEYAAWIEPLVPVGQGPHELVVAAPSQRFVHTVEENYRALIDREAAALRSESFQVVLTAQPRDTATRRETA